MSDKIQLIGAALAALIPYSFTWLYQRIQAIQHNWSYIALPTAKNVVIIGGSFGGIQLAQRLCETLPTGYKVTMVEKNSHLNFSWAFPRFSVIPGYEEQAFIPYDGIALSAPAGIFNRVHDAVTHITANEVVLASGKTLDYTYLAIATGSSQPVPAKVLATDSQEGCTELRKVQENIHKADRIAVVGGGPVGIEIASDINSFFPIKDVTLFHSRGQILPQFGRRLHDHVSGALEKLGIKVILQARPQILPDKRSLRLEDKVEEFDLIIPCTGQRPNSTILENLEADAISMETGRILVKPTLQIRSPSDAFPHIFAFGDVAETGGPKMARAAQSQAGIVVANILALIQEQIPSATYTPRTLVEGAIKLTLGKDEYVIYAQRDDGSDMLVPWHGGKEDLDIGRAWSHLGVEYKKNT